MGHQQSVAANMRSSDGYDGSGLWVCAKQLQKGRFRWPDAENEGRVAMSHEELTLLLNGIDLDTAKRRKWYRKEPA